MAGITRLRGCFLAQGLPKRLKADAILETTFEIRFDTDASIIPEIMFGRLADAVEWKAFRPARLPTADIPAPIRRSDPNLMYAPAIELTSPDGGIRVRFGPNSISYTRVGNYPGWDEKLSAEIENAIDHLFKAVHDVTTTRLGLRYINALKSDIHGIKSVGDLAISVTVADDVICDSINLNFKTNVNSDYEATCRIASVDLAQGTIPENATVIIDIDVYTIGTFSTRDAAVVKEWVTKAHQTEKENFFKLLGPDVTARLRED